MDNVTQILNYWGLMDNAIQPLTTEAKLLPSCPLIAVSILIDKSANQDD